MQNLKCNHEVFTSAVGIAVALVFSQNMLAADSSHSASANVIRQQQQQVEHSPPPPQL